MSLPTTPEPESRFVDALLVEIGQEVLYDGAWVRIEGSFIDGNGKVNLEHGGRWHRYHRHSTLEVRTPA